MFFSAVVVKEYHGRGGQNLLEALRAVPSRQIKALHRVRRAIHIANGHSVSHSIPGIQDNPRGVPRGIQIEHGPDRLVKSRTVERLEHDWQHLLSVRLWVQNTRYILAIRLFIVCGNGVAVSAEQLRTDCPTFFAKFVFEVKLLDVHDLC